MRLKVTNQHGITLVEILAAIVISSFIIFTTYNVLTSGQKQARIQTEKNYNLRDTAYVFKVISKEIRKSDQVYVNGEASCSNTLCISGVAYQLDSSNNLNKGNEVLANNIETFGVEKVGEKLTITLKQKENEAEAMEIVLR